MSVVQVQDLIEAGVHYGHRASKWNPKMRPYIYGKRNLIHIIDLRETVRGMIRASRFLNRVVSKGSLVVFLGTKRQAQESIERESKRCFMPFVSERWIGGAFTNFRTVRDRLKRLKELEKLMSTGEINRYSKKMRATLMREYRKVHRNINGIRTMNRLPGAVVVVDANREQTALKEARKMGIPVIGLIDTDSDPDFIDLAIPGNDDSIRSIDLVLGKMADAVLSGLNSLPSDQVEKMQSEFTVEHTPVVIKEVEEEKEVTATPVETNVVIDTSESNQPKIDLEAAEPKAEESKPAEATAPAETAETVETAASE